MNLCKTLGEKPSPKITKIMLLVSIILIFVSYSIMGYYYFQSGDSVPMLTSQLSFSDAFLKWQYSLMSPAGLESYRITQTFDYLFMISYGLLAFTLAVFIGRKFEEKSAWRSMGFIFAVVGPISAGFDAIENLFILLTLTDPAGFPGWWAIVHSTCALVKWIILLVAIGWALVASIYYYTTAMRRKK